MWPQVPVQDDAERSAAQREWWETQNGRPTGDPDKLAQALLTIAAQDPPPRRFLAGADAIALAEQKTADLRADIDACPGLSAALTLDSPGSRG